MRIPLCAAVAALLVTSTPAAAASIWLKCDGLPGQGMEEAKQMAKVLVPLLVAGAPEVAHERPQATPEAGVEACTAALDHPSIKDSWRRRANILKARAVHNLFLRKADAALADVKAARDVAGEHLAEAGVRRSLGVSLLIAEASAYAELERKDEAVKAAVAAADGRPYAPSVQQAAAIILHGLAVEGPDWERIVARLDALSPGVSGGVARQRAKLDPQMQQLLDQVERGGQVTFGSPGLPLSYLILDVPQMEEANDADTLKPQVPVFREAGYQEKRLPTGGIHVEFVDPGPVGEGNAVQELVLLRAAQLAKAANAKGFVITKRQDGRLWRQVLHNGAVMSQFIHGFKSTVDVSFVAADAPAPEHMVSAEEVLEALSPAFS